MRILHLISSTLASGGGPIEGLIQLAPALHVRGHQVEVVSLEDPAAPHLRQFPLPIHALGPSLGRYKFNHRMVPWLRRHAGEYDVVIVNGIWEYHSFATWRALAGGATPYVVFTHGMLGPWFKHTYPLKHLKKWLYWPWADYRVLRDAQAVIFTCEEERRRARESFSLYQARERVVAYGTAAPPEDDGNALAAFATRYPGLENKRLIIFVGRITPVKGCDLLLEAFRRVAPEHPELHLMMVGPAESPWAQALQQRSQEWGLASRVTWTGMLRGAEKWQVFRRAEALILPSHHENFGVVVAEALACGLPTLISNGVNIWREVAADGAAIVEDDNQAGTARLLRRWLALTDDERQRMARLARPCFDRRFTSETMAESLLNILQPIVDAAPQRKRR